MPDTPEANAFDQALVNVLVGQRDAALNEAARQTARAIVAEAQLAALKSPAEDVSSEGTAAS